MSTSVASAIPARRSPSRTGLAGRCSWNSQVPAITTYALLATLDTGTTMDARKACSPAWKSSMATPRQPASTYRYGEERTPVAMPAAVWWLTRMPESALIARAATP